MKVQKTFFLFFLSFCFCNCSVSDKDIKHYKYKFELHRKDFENLITLLSEQNLEKGFSINENNLSDNIKSILKKLSVSRISINNSSCNVLNKYEFTSNWCGNATLYFSKDVCDKQQTEKGFHTKHSEMIEVWGLGNDWVMWLDYDFV